MTDAQIRIVRALRDGIPMSEEPFAEIAARAGVSVDELLEQLRAWQSDGTIRRFGAILRHHRAGYSANAMVVWNVPDDSAEDFGAIASSYRNVSHCYQRPRFAGFAYNLYTMIHGRSKEECDTTVGAISDRSGVRDFAMLYTTSEFKKTSPVYFASRTQRKRSALSEESD